MSVKKPDRSEDEDAPKRESRGDRKRRQREAVKRQKALVASERARRKEREKAERRAGKPTAEDTPAKDDRKRSDKPRKAEKPTAKAPESKRPSAKKPSARKPSAKEAVREKGRRRRRGFGAKRVGAGARGVGTGAKKIGGGVASVGSEILKLGREMLVIPLQLWLGLAEIVGRAVLLVWLRVVLPALRLLWRFAGAALRFGERHVTPARMLALVSLVAIGALIAAQWRDYSAISVGVDAYAGDVGAVAPPPEVSSAPTHDAHGWVMLIIGALALVALIGAVTRRRRLAIWLVPLGIAVIAISVGIDAPKGLDEGDAAVAYESASASLLSGFWLQVAAGAVLIAAGLMLPGALRPVRASERAGEPGPSLIDRAVARTQRARERRRARPQSSRRSRRLPKLRRPEAKGKVQGARP